MKTSISKRGADAQRCALALVPVFSRCNLGPSAKLLDEATGGQLTRAAGGSAFEGKTAQTLTVHAPAAGVFWCARTCRRWPWSPHLQVTSRWR